MRERPVPSSLEASRGRADRFSRKNHLIPENSRSRAQPQDELLVLEAPTPRRVCRPLGAVSLRIRATPLKQTKADPTRPPRPRPLPPRRAARPPACWRPPARPAIIPQTSRPSLHRSQNTSSKPARSSYASTNCAPGRKSVSCSRRLGRKLPACFWGCPKASVTNWVAGSDRASPAPGAGGRRSGTGPAAGRAPWRRSALLPAASRLPGTRCGPWRWPHPGCQLHPCGHTATCALCASRRLPCDCAHRCARASRSHARHQSQPQGPRSNPTTAGKPLRPHEAVP